MKRVKSIIYILGILAITSGIVLGQDDLRVPLTNPGSPGKLNLNAVFADDIIIKAHDGNDVVVKFDGDDDDDGGKYSRNGLRRISTNGVGLEVTEDNNTVRIKTAPNSHDLDLEIWVPKNFSMNIQVTHGDLSIEGVMGEHEVRATNGDVEMIQVGGSVVVNSVNGDIEVSMVSVTPNTPMSFTGLNGDIEVSFPSNTKFTGKMKTDYGDVFTNFDISIDRSQSASEISSGDGKYTVTVNKWITGTVNGGGPEFLFKTLHGDIEISKN
ncbi:MAG: DUF4097 family beta strand repeat protein [Balneolaceae bacterium]|nr:DUF4097 family beta strand repeat protein [Balneolaceae bacterium]MBO6547191.1 DUF4097 family beta strand repeat protein [Balneolaceae bacterium]MBO6647862.1 DUF4097 family beta strand repeat protein [Balneolaceae bacterium]